MKHVREGCFDYRQKKKGLLSTLESEADIDEGTAEKINSIIPEEYASVSAVKRDKEVVNLKTSIEEFLNLANNSENKMRAGTSVEKII